MGLSLNLFFIKLRQKVNAADIPPVYRSTGVVEYDRKRILLGNLDTLIDLSTKPDYWFVNRSMINGAWQTFLQHLNIPNFFDEFKEEHELREELKRFLGKD